MDNNQEPTREYIIGLGMEFIEGFKPLAAFSSVPLDIKSQVEEIIATHREAQDLDSPLFPLQSLEMWTDICRVILGREFPHPQENAYAAIYLHAILQVKALLAEEGKAEHRAVTLDEALFAVGGATGLEIYIMQHYPEIDTGEVRVAVEMVFRSPKALSQR